MIGEREDILTETNYGDLVMRSYDIENNKINAFYDGADDLVFVVDNTITEKKPNVLLVINPDGDKKWDEILSTQYNVDLETIRPKQDNKYQKLDIEYSGLSIYENLINAFVSGDDISEQIVQLNILRDSAARHSAMTRLNVANEIITKTNATIVRTKEAIVRLQERLKTLRSKLTQQKKEIGKVPTKQSASKILKIEAQIDATNEKIKRAKRRLESAQKRLEIATVDAELASDLLNQPETEIVQTAPKSKSVAVAKKHEVLPVVEEDSDDEDELDEESDEDDDNNEVKPLFDKDPGILNEEIAFKPISFDAPTFIEEEKPLQSIEDFQNKPVPQPVEEIQDETALQSIIDFQGKPVENVNSYKEDLDFTPPVLNEQAEEIIEKPVEEIIKPVENITVEPEQKPVLETFTPIQPVAEEPTIEQYEPMMPEETQNPIQEPVEDVIKPVPPIPQINNNEVKPVAPLQNYTDVMNKEHKKPAFVYYILLLVLIVLSVFTLWVYQKNMGTTTPALVAPAVEEQTAEKTEPVVKEEPKVENVVVDSEEVFLDVVEQQPAEEQAEEKTETPAAEEQTVEPEPEAPVTEETPVAEPEPAVVEEQPAEPTEPVVLGDVPAKVMTSGIAEEEETDEEPIAEPVVDKPVYEVGSKHDDMFITEEPVVEEEASAPAEETQPEENSETVFVDDPSANINDESFDAEEAAYQAEQSELEYEE